MAEKIFLIIFGFFMIFLVYLDMNRIPDIYPDDYYFSIPKIIYRIIHPLKKSDYVTSRKEILYYTFICLPNAILCIASIAVSIFDISTGKVFIALDMIYIFPALFIADCLLKLIKIIIEKIKSKGSY